MSRLPRWGGFAPAWAQSKLCLEHAVLVRDGKIFIAYSASATDQNYCMGVLTADMVRLACTLQSSWTSLLPMLS
ncbi:MAG TPA: hypothetical protein VIV60_21175 [Polyangiaceae bacterium]